MERMKDEDDLPTSTAEPPVSYAADVAEGGRIQNNNQPMWMDGD